MQAYPNAVIKLDNSAGTLTDISAYLDAEVGWSPEGETKRYSYTPMSTGIEVEIGGAIKKKVNLTALDETAAATFFEAIRGKTGLDFEIHPDGTGSTKRKVTGTCSCVHVGVFGHFKDGIGKVPIELSIQTGPTEGTQT